MEMLTPCKLPVIFRAWNSKLRHDAVFFMMTAKGERLELRDTVARHRLHNGEAVLFDCTEQSREI